MGCSQISQNKPNDLIASVIKKMSLCIRQQKIPQTALQGLFCGKRKKSS